MRNSGNDATAAMFEGVHVFKNEWSCVVVVFFFFQAEDGIRDYKVTGVQTCALPISAGFNRLIALQPQEIQVGILKRLRGTPIVRHDAEWQMAYNPHPPYELLQNKQIGRASCRERV